MPQKKHKKHKHKKHKKRKISIESEDLMDISTDSELKKTFKVKMRKEDDKRYEIKKIYYLKTIKNIQ